MTLRSYHFNMGNSTKGSIGYCARIKAHSREEAVAILNRVLPETVVVYENLFDEDGIGVEYIHTYFGINDVTAKAKGDSTEVAAKYPGEANFFGADWPWELKVGK